ncbi:hypothetical protein [Kineococcus arenarius]|uniref:hypothetical protein n=1 Tax=Kineococcus sp. SYSU DK007 TaxID=3383128 RepID=UPI003D7DABCF
MKDVAYVQKFVDVLNLLSSAASQQISFLEKRNFPVDELALMFDDYFAPWRHLAEGEIPAEVKAVLKELDDYLTRMSGVSSNWSYEALGSADDWQTVRQLARRCIKEIWRSSFAFDS